MPSGRLTFVGLGLHDERGVTIEGMSHIVDADIAFAELYTSSLAEGSLQRLASSTHKNIELLDRAAIEDGTHILEQASAKKVVLLVAGDPMAATTHIELRVRAIAQGTETRVIGGVSALTAVPGLLGLQQYKFGRTVTLPFPQEGYSPTSPYELMGKNLEIGLHTMVLLDIDAENDRWMTAAEGFHLLLDMERRVGKKIISEDTLACVVARAGSPDCVVRAGKISDLKDFGFGKPLHSIVIPGDLHFMELDALKVLAGLDPSWVESRAHQSSP